MHTVCIIGYVSKLKLCMLLLESETLYVLKQAKSKPKYSPHVQLEMRSTIDQMRLKKWLWPVLHKKLLTLYVLLQNNIFFFVEKKGTGFLLTCLYFF